MIIHMKQASYFNGREEQTVGGGGKGVTTNGNEVKSVFPDSRVFNGQTFIPCKLQSYSTHLQSNVWSITMLRLLLYCRVYSCEALNYEGHTCLRL